MTSDSGSWNGYLFLKYKQAKWKHQEYSLRFKAKWSRIISVRFSVVNMNKSEFATFLNYFSRGSLWFELYSKIWKILGVKNVARNIAKIPTTSYIFWGQCFPKHFSLPAEKQKLSAICLFLCQTMGEWISIFPLFSVDPGIWIGPPVKCVNW